MDPNEALALVRKLTTLVRSGPEGPEEWADDLADAVSGLDEHLSRGGFLPADWDPRCAENFRGCTHMGPHFHG